MYILGQPPPKPKTLRSVAQSKFSHLKLVSHGEQRYIQKCIPHEFGFISHGALSELDILHMLQPVKEILNFHGAQIDNGSRFWKSLFPGNPSTTKIYVDSHPGDLMDASFKQSDGRSYVEACVYRGSQVPHILRDICTGMYILEELGISHHDIKPDNILLSDSGKYMLCDFGLSAMSVYSGVTSGTLNYVAPEFLYDHLPRLGYAHDYYSLGVSLCTYILCKYLFNPQTLEDLQVRMKDVYPSIENITQPGGLNISAVENYVDPLTYDILCNLCLFNPLVRYTPRRILEVYGVPLPSLESIYENYPEVDVLRGRRVWPAQTLADEIYSRYQSIHHKPMPKIKQACLELAQLRLFRHRIPNKYHSTVMHILQTLDYRVYNPRLASWL